MTPGNERVAARQHSQPNGADSADGRASTRIMPPPISTLLLPAAATCRRPT